MSNTKDVTPRIVIVHGITADSYHVMFFNIGADPYTMTIDKVKAEELAKYLSLEISNY